MSQYPNLYPSNKDDEDDPEINQLVEEKLSQLDRTQTDDDNTVPNVDKHVTDVSSAERKT